VEVEAIVLTGGASRRMGQDKARLSVNGEVLSERIARDLLDTCSRVTVLGKEPIAGLQFLPDVEEYAGPLVALSRFEPVSEAVFVTSCDLPRFDARLVDLFLELLQDNDAVLPLNEEQVQPLCALYRADAWGRLHEAVVSGKKSMMAWLDGLKYRTVPQGEIASAGIDRRAIGGANTPEEWERLLRD